MFLFFVLFLYTPNTTVSRHASAEGMDSQIRLVNIWRSHENNLVITAEIEHSVLRGDIYVLLSNTLNCHEETSFLQQERKTSEVSVGVHSGAKPNFTTTCITQIHTSNWVFSRQVPTRIRSQAICSILRCLNNPLLVNLCQILSYFTTLHPIKKNTWRRWNSQPDRPTNWILTVIPVFTKLQSSAVGKKISLWGMYDFT